MKIGHENLKITLWIASPWHLGRVWGYSPYVRKIISYYADVCGFSGVAAVTGPLSQTVKGDFTYIICNRKEQQITPIEW